uniref:Fatty acid synthase n=1 Tax=Timema genevievae TaxID=629358 RepID=A0A7R9PM34_TIMGE|nr:unnamed protein product [Timema genevievae]
MPSLTGNIPLVDMADYEKLGCLHQMFSRQAKSTPDSVAVVTHDGKQMTFGELDKASDLLALKLRHLGVKRNTVVGILMERCPEYTIAYIGILKAGGAYMPLEISHPHPLMQSVLEDSAPVAVCTKSQFSQRLSGLVDSSRVLLMEGDWLEELARLEVIPETVQVSLDDMAYTVYSSGTTGKPKGIQCPHRGAVFSYHWRHSAYPYQPGDREACNVFFVWEMLRPLLKGVPLYIVPDDVIYDPPKLTQFLKRHAITRMLFTPSLLQAVLDFRGLDLEDTFKTMSYIIIIIIIIIIINNNCFQPVARQIWFCGEVVSSILRDRVAKLLSWVQLLNLYSISECHDLACADLSGPKPQGPAQETRKFCPVGQLLPMVNIVVMDDEMTVKPVGAPGEIYVGGPTLALGYLNRPELTSQRFISRPVHVPSSVGSRLYRTGDWGYMLSGGTLEICGRCDSMVKIRGYSIEIQIRGYSIEIQVRLLMQGAEEYRDYILSGGTWKIRGRCNSMVKIRAYSLEIEVRLRMQGAEGYWDYILSGGTRKICVRCDSLVNIRRYNMKIQVRLRMQGVEEILGLYSEWRNTEDMRPLWFYGQETRPMENDHGVAFYVATQCNVRRVRGILSERSICRLTAVEAALLQLPMVNTGCVLVLGDEGSDKFLVAYIVSEGKTSRKEVRAELKKRLPFYMIPSKFVFLNRIPMVEATGKLDKKALPKIDMDEENGLDPQDLPSTQTEHIVAAIWCRVLELQVIDVQENFFDLGGHSLLAARLLSEMNEQLGLDLIISDLFSHPTVYSMAGFIDDPQVTSGETVKLDLNAEVDRHDQGKSLMDISLRAFWRSFQLSHAKFRRDKVLLTGVTGFVGAFILKELLTSTKATVYCLVRETPGSTPLQRIKDTLWEYGILRKGAQADEMDKKIEARVVPIKGDIALVNLGMSEDDYMYLSYEVDSIIHAAAMVNLVYPYRALHGANVLGTENVILFALEHKIKPIHHISFFPEESDSCDCSTNAVFPCAKEEYYEDDDMSKYPDKLTSGYAQSKWVSEQLIELTPVDFVCKMIVGLTQDIMHSIGKTFHLINTSSMDCRDLWQLLRVQGFPVKIVPYQTWYSNVKTGAQNGEINRADNPLTSLLYMLDTLVRHLNLDNTMAMQAVTYPEVDADLMRLYLKHLSTLGFIQRPQKRCRNCKVVLVTGASSGIGAAVAEHLAMAGAKVALVARRLDRLKELQASIEAQGGVAISVKMDVCVAEEVGTYTCNTSIEAHGGVIISVKMDVCVAEEVAVKIKQAMSLLGPINILVNNAGVMHYTQMKHAKLDQWHRMVDVNVNGQLNCLAAVLPGMVERGDGHIVSITSDAGRKVQTGGSRNNISVYSGTKYFLEGMYRALRQEVCGSGVKVTCIQPGDVKTEILLSSSDQEALSLYGPNKDRMLDPADVAQAVMYAVTQPAQCAVNEILLEPKESPI